MKFSVIVPVYNVERYLRRCLNSILAQSCQDYEMILIDDGSLDRSGEICDQYVEISERVKVIHQENQGLSGARNTGLSAASGDWIVFVDSDDWIDPDMLEIISMHMQKTEADIYSFNARKVDENDQVTEKLLYAVENETITFRKEEQRFQFYFDQLMRYKTGWEAWGSIYKKSIIEQHGLRFISTREIFAEDYLFTFQYMLCADSIARMCNIFYNYFQRSDSLLHSTEKEQILPKLYRIGEIGYRTVCRKHMRYFRKYYHRLYFMLMNYHLQFALSGLPQEVLERNLEEIAGHRLHRRWIRRIMKERDLYQKYMEIRTWL